MTPDPLVLAAPLAVFVLVATVWFLVRPMFLGR